MFVQEHGGSGGQEGPGLIQLWAAQRGGDEGPL